MSYIIALVQFNPIRKNPEENLQIVQNLLADTKADLIVLPELANSGYLYASNEELHPFSEPNDGSGPFLFGLKKLALHSNGAIVTGYAERESKGLYNSAAAITADGVIARYRKTHLYADEKSLFLPGDSGFPVFSWRDVTIGMMICFDWIFPESARSLALAGAQIIAHPSNLILPYCQDAMVTRSIENRVFTITANRVGTEDLGETRLIFTGQSQFTHPNGKVLYRAPIDQPAVHMISIDPDESLDKWISSRNHLLQDRRSQFYRQ